MKKLLLFLLLCATYSQAAVTVGPSMGQARVFIGASSTAGVFLVDQYGNVVSPGTVTVNGVSLSAGTATIGNVGVTNTVAVAPASGSNPWPITGTVNASGFNFLSATVVSSGVTTNADTVLSLTWAASTTTGSVFGDLNCSAMTGMYFMINNSATAFPGWVGNSALFGYQPCGQISQVPLEWNAADTPHLHAVAMGLSNTSGAFAIVTKKRP